MIENFDFRTESVEESANVLNSNMAQIEDLTLIQLVSILTKKEIFKLLADETVEEINKKIEITDLKGSVTPDDVAQLLLEENRIDEKVIRTASGITATEVGSSMMNIGGPDALGVVIATLGVVAAIPNIVTEAQALANTVGENINTALGEFTSQIDQVTNIIRQPIEEFADLFDTGFGFNNAIGGAVNTGNFLKNNQVTTVVNTSVDTYITLDKTLTESLSQDWKTRETIPGNPLILEAYALSGRNYKKDGTKYLYNWNTSFVNWALNKSGLFSLEAMSPSAYHSYGSPVDFGTFQNVRKHDIIIFTNVNRLAVIGFVQDFDKATQNISVLGGNFQGTVKLVSVPFSRTSPTIRVTHVRRNWAVPAEFDKPFFGDSLVQQPQVPVYRRPPLGPENRIRYTSETPAEEQDRLSGGLAASGGTLV